MAQNNVTDAAVSALFPNLTGAEFFLGTADYQCVFVVNRHPKYPMGDAVIWFTGDNLIAAQHSLAVDNIPPSAIGSGTDQAASVATKNDAPVNVGSFATPITKDTALQLGTIGPNQVKAVWLRRSWRALVSLRAQGTLVCTGAKTFDVPAGINNVRLSTTGTLSPHPGSTWVPYAPQPVAERLTLHVEANSAF